MQYKYTVYTHMSICINTYMCTYVRTYTVIDIYKYEYLVAIIPLEKHWIAMKMVMVMLYRSIYTYVFVRTVT
jgi:hypothetical protein